MPTTPITKVEYAIARGSHPSYSVVHIFGRNPNIGTSFAPVIIVADYPMPQVAGAKALRIKAGGNANDTVAGTGARKVQLEGLDTDGQLCTQVLDTAGASASAYTPLPYWRFFKGFVLESGTYADNTNNSHAGDITFEDDTGREWGILSVVDGIGRAQTEIGWYTIPANKNGFLLDVTIHSDSSKAIEALVQFRENALSTPFTALRTTEEFSGVTNQEEVLYPIPFGPLVGPCDIGVIAKVASGSAAVTVDFDILLENK